MRHRNGFTLIELIIVMGILAVLFSLTLVALNPARDFAQANNTRRRADVVSILNAINQYMADYSGALPPGLAPGDIDKHVRADASCTNCTGTNFCNAIVPRYIASMPKDPANGVFTSCSADHNIGYMISVSNPPDSADSPRVTVSAVYTELSAAISVTR